MKLTVLITIIILGLYLTSMGQEVEDTIIRVNDVLFNYGFVDYGGEYYVVDSKNSFLEHHLYYQPYVNDKNIFIIEFGVVQSFLDIGNYVSPSDLSLTYQRNFKSKSYGSTGFQGIASSLKFTIPTGRDEYLSGLNSWTIEPLIGSQWLFSNVNWFTSFQLRYSHSFASLPTYTPRFDILRVEYFYGFENNRGWLFLETDYRFTPDKADHNLFLAINGGYKLNNQLGFKVKIKPRIIGSEFYSSLFILGFYTYLHLK